MIITDKLLTPGSKHGRTGQKLVNGRPSGIVIHYTGSPNGTAINVRNWFENGSEGRCVSAHYIVGLAGEVIRCIPDDERAQHAGAAYGDRWKTQAPKNNSLYIGIETCHPDATGKFSDVTYLSVIELCADLCSKHSLEPGMDIFRHYDVSGKSCPLWYVNHPADWAEFVNDIKKRKPEIAEAKADIIFTPILASASVNVQHMKTWATAKNAAALYIELADAFYNTAVSAGVDPAVAYCQSAVETGFGRFGGIIDETFHNTCGMKTTSGGGNDDPNAHMRFRTWSESIQAQIDHLALYAGAQGYPKPETPDPRHFASLYGKAVYVDELSGKWATNPGYGAAIINLVNQLKALVPRSIDLSIDLSMDSSSDQGAIDPNRPSGNRPSGNHPAGNRPVGNRPVGSNDPSIDPSRSQSCAVSESSRLPAWAAEAWTWATAVGVTDGARPTDTATRQEVITMIWNTLNIQKKILDIR